MRLNIVLIIRNTIVDLRSKNGVGFFTGRILKGIELAIRLITTRQKQDIANFIGHATMVFQLKSIVLSLREVSAIFVKSLNLQKIKSFVSTTHTKLGRFVVSYVITVIKHSVIYTKIFLFSKVSVSI